MRKIIVLAALVGILLTVSAIAQQPPTGGVQNVTVDPSGNCAPAGFVQYNTVNGNLWTCGNVVNHIGTWQKANGSGSGTVNSGTAGQLAYYGANGTAVSALPGHLFIPASGDTTCATDTAAINAAITAANASINLGPSTYYAGTGTSPVFTLSGPMNVRGAGPGQTVIQKCTANSDLFKVIDQIPGGATAAQAVGHGGSISGFDVTMKSGVTATGGCDVNLASAGGAGFYVSGWHIENIHSYGTWDAFCTGTGVITDWFKNDRAYNELHSAYYYNTPSPGGDIHNDGFEAAGTSTTGFIFDYCDTNQVTDFKLNGSNITFLGQHACLRPRFLGGSIEGLSGGPTACIDFGSVGTTAVTQPMVLGTYCGLSSFTAIYAHIANTTNPMISINDYVAGDTAGLKTNMYALPGCASGTQVSDKFLLNVGMSLDTHPTECVYPYASYGYLSTNTATLGVSSGGGSISRVSGGAGGDYYVANFTPSSANYTVSMTCTAGAAGDFCRVIGRVSLTAYTGYEAILISGTGVGLYKVVAGTVTQLGTTYTGVTSGTHTIAIGMSGTTITVAVDGTTQITQTDSSITAAGTAVLGLSGASSISSFTVQ